MFRQLFDYEELDWIDESVIFMTCRLKQPVGKFPQGIVLSSITVDLKTGIMSIENPHVVARYVVQPQITGEPVEERAQAIQEE